MKRGSKQKVVPCPKCNLPCAFHKVNPHLNGNFCWGEEYKIETEDDMILYKYWKYKKSNYLRRTDIDFLLSPLQIITLLKEANISIRQVGNGKGKYNLSRHNDTGNYEIGNCRFIPQIDNLMEREYGLRYIIDGIEYKCTKEVAELFKCGRVTVRRRCEHPTNYPNWKLKIIT